MTTDVPKDAREQIEALLRNQPVGYERQGNAHPPPWLLRLALRALDTQDAASEAVTEEMLERALKAWHASTAETMRDGFRVMIETVAPALIAAGERRGLERAAADYERRADELCAEADDHDKAALHDLAASAHEYASTLRLLAFELRRALGRPA